MEVKVMENNFHKDAIRWQMSKSINVTATGKILQICPKIVYVLLMLAIVKNL